MNTLDIILLVILGYSAFRGFRKGFLLEIVTIVAFIVAVIGGFKLLHWGMDMLDRHFDISGALLPYLAFILIFIAIIVLMNILGKVLKKVLDMTLLGAVDNLAGAILAVFKWSFGISVILWLSNSFGLTLPEGFTSGSLLYPYLLPLAPTIVEYSAVIMPFAQDLFDGIKNMLEGDPTT